MKRWLLSVMSANRLEIVGLRLIVFGLIADALLIIDALTIEYLPYKLDKPLSAAFTLAIAAGVWLEYVGAEALKRDADARAATADLKVAQLDKKITPRVISEDAGLEIIEKIKPFSGIAFAVATDPAAEYGFVNRIIELLQRAGWKWQSYSASLISLPSGDSPRACSADAIHVEIRRKL
jgi:hypothetical protein